MSISISISYEDIKKLLKDFRNLWRRTKKEIKEDPDKCERCKEFRFCGNGLGFLTRAGGLDAKKIKVIKKEEGIMTIDLREIARNALLFLSGEAYTEFHHTLHDYAESMNYVGVLNHVLSQMSLLDVWLKRVAARAKDFEEPSIAVLQQIKEILPVIYITRKDPYQGGFRKTKLAREFFVEEMPHLLDEATYLLRAGSTRRFEKKIDEIVQKVIDLRSELMSDLGITLDSSLKNGEKLRTYFDKK